MSEFQKSVKNGAPNPKYVDLLEEDKAIAFQKFVCVSFVSPEKILKNKEHFLFECFLKKYDFNKSMEKFLQFLNFVSYKYKLNFEDVTTDLKEFVKEEQDILAKLNITDEYKTFIDKNEEDLEQQFNALHNFQTSTRGLKVRGVFPTQGEAELRCKLLREVDPNHDVFVGPVGLWMPWDPEAYKTGRVEYMEDELNQLMHEKTKNELSAKTAFESRIQETKRKAITENVKKAEKTGNVLTQMLDDAGNLVGVNNVNTQELKLSSNENVSINDIKMELFEGDNIVVGKSDYGQSELVSGPFALPNKKRD